MAREVDTKTARKRELDFRNGTPVEATKDQDEDEDDEE